MCGCFDVNEQPSLKRAVGFQSKIYSALTILQRNVNYFCLMWVDFYPLCYINVKLTKASKVVWWIFYWHFKKKMFYEDFFISVA